VNGHFAIGRSAGTSHRDASDDLELRCAYSGGPERWRATMLDGSPSIIYSELCCTLTLDGITVDLQIYRLEQDARWVLEVVNDAGSSTIWEDQFDTEQDALKAFEEIVIDEGLKVFLDNGDVETLH
jgi:hypothetical protein